MSTGRINNSGPDWSSQVNAANNADVVFDVKKKRINIERSQIKSIAQGLAEIAYSMGETNNPEEFAEYMEEDILEAFKKAKKKRDKKKQNP